MGRVGADTVRAFIAEAGLTKARIPDSTRALLLLPRRLSAGQRHGLEGMQAMVDATSRIPVEIPAGPQRRRHHGLPGRHFVGYYKRALTGAYFKKQETLTEFKRIQAMADAIALLVPADTPAYMKGGSIDWNGFHCLAAAGQMIVRGLPVTFALTLNWRDSDGDAAAVGAAFKKAAADVLERVRAHIVKGAA